MTTRAELLQKHCEPCKGGTPALKGEKLNQLLNELGPGWNLIDDSRLEKEYRFKDFREALEFTNKVGRVAEEEGHHPLIVLSWGKVKVKLMTHKIKGLSESDFIMAAKCDQL